MQDFIDAIIFAFKEILKASTMKFAIFNGMLISIFWIFIGINFWSDIISVTSSFLSLLPFSMLRSNGAWMLSTFLWLQAVLVTFALIFAFFGNIIVTKIKRDKYASFSIIIAILSAIFWAIIWFFEGDYIYAKLLKLLTWLPFETIEKSISYLIGFYIVYTAIIVTSIIITSLFSNKFLLQIKEKYFPYDTMYDDNEEKNIIQTLKDTVIFIAISALSLPLLFIPIINFLILVGLWMWLMKDTFSNDTAAFVFGKIDKEKLKEYKVSIWGISIISSLFNFIPVFNLFGPYFNELAMFYYLKEKRDLQTS